MASQLNTFANSLLNRASWLREEKDWISQAARSDAARFLLLHELNPLCSEATGDLALKLLSWKELEPHLGDLSSTALAEFSGRDGPISAEEVDSRPLFVFLGVDESNRGGAALPEEQQATPTDPAIFALDTTHLPSLRESLLSSSENPTFAELRGASARLSAHESAIAGQARALTDWNKRNRYCAGCGRPTVSVWAGWKRQCLPDSETSNGSARPPCVTKKGVHNFTYPRTDAVIISGVTNPAGDKILLGRQKSWPKGFYSCLAGFIEPCETLEEAVAREIWEEAGVKVTKVEYIASQPWPFPSSLMFGCMGVATDDQPIRTDLCVDSVSRSDAHSDNELEDARWFPREAILRALDSNAANLTRQEIQKARPTLE